MKKTPTEEELFKKAYSDPSIRGFIDEMTKNSIEIMQHGRNIEDLYSTAEDFPEALDNYSRANPNVDIEKCIEAMPAVRIGKNLIDWLEAIDGKLVFDNGTISLISKNSQFNTEQTKFFVETLNNSPEVTSLTFDGINNSAEHILEIMANMLYITTLIINNNNLPLEMPKLAELLKLSDKLTKFAATNSLLTPEALGNLVEGLKGNKSITKLDLSHNKSVTSDYVLGLLEGNKQIKYLSLEDTPISWEEKCGIGKILVERRNLNLEEIHDTVPTGVIPDPDSDIIG